MSNEYKCKICEREDFHNFLSLSIHLKKHSISLIDYLAKYEGFEIPKCKCGKDLKRYRGFHFAKNCGECTLQYQCEYCKKVFDKKQSFCAHHRHCKQKANGNYVKPFNGNQGWNKGLTKENHPSLKKISIKNIERLRNNPQYSWNHYNFRITKEEKEAKAKKQSETRKKKYSNGELSPAKGVGKGKYSYLIYKDKKYLLRSTYEFIFVLFLVYKKIDFEYENVRVTHRGKTKINDFQIGNLLYEIKGIPKDHKIKEIRESFESNGYKIKFLYKKQIEKIKSYLIRNGFDVDNLVKEIYNGHNSKNYFCFNADEL